MWENIDIKLVTIEARRNYLVSEPNNHTSKYFSENVLAIEMKKTKQNNKNKKKKQVFINEPIYLALLLLKMIKIVMYEIFGMIMWNQNI